MLLVWPPYQSTFIYETVLKGKRTAGTYRTNGTCLVHKITVAKCNTCLLFYLLFILNLWPLGSFFEEQMLQLS
jgi:hypothetical protein